MSADYNHYNKYLICYNRGCEHVEDRIEKVNDTIKKLQEENDKLKA